MLYSMLVSREIAQEANPERYGLLGINPSMEPYYMPWGMEEFAVGSLLWDLVDPVDARDATVKGGATYRDCIETDWKDLWGYLTADYAGVVGSSAVAQAQGYGYVFDIKHLYDVLKHHGVGSSHSRGREATDLDELFIAHGFFVDADGDHVYDVDEEVGRAAYPARPDRRNVPPIVGSYVAFQALEEGSVVPVELASLTVDVTFAPPFEHYGYGYRQAAGQDRGRFYFMGPDSQYEATTRIIAWAPGRVSTEPLTVTNAFYWEQMATLPEDHFVEHTFEMEDASGVHLPLVMGRPTTFSLAESRHGPDAVDRTLTQDDVSCRPEAPTATPTASATPTATATPDHDLPVVEAIVPASAPSGQAVQVTIYGYFFKPGAVPQIGTTTLTSVEFLDPEPASPHRSRIRGVLSAGLPPGTYDVTVTNPGAKAGALRNGFTVTAAPTETLTPMATRTATPTTTAEAEWQTVYADGFEGEFPGPWQRGSGAPTWARTDCRSQEGSSSIWPAGDREGAATPCVDNYPNDVNSWLVYGPFDLSGATAAQVTFQRWQRTESDYDFFEWRASVDGAKFYGWKSSGYSEGWGGVTFDLTDVGVLGNLCGEPQVWVAFVFTSDDSVTYEGVFLDDVVVRKKTGTGASAARAGAEESDGAVARRAEPRRRPRVDSTRGGGQ